MDFLHCPFSKSLQAVGFLFCPRAVLVPVNLDTFGKPKLGSFSEGMYSA